MNDRFAELLAKGSSGLLTPEEESELAHLLNAPILTEPGRFVSRFRFVPGDVPARIRAIDWFSRCGTPPQLNLSMTAEPVEGWSQAATSCGQLVWENAQLEAQNQLTFWLHQNVRDEYRDWNRRVVEYKAQVIEPITRDVLAPIIRSRGLPEGLQSWVEWDLLGALMENSYLPTGHRCGFFLELLTVYEAGHFPCGWRGTWPAGSLLVF